MNSPMPGNEARKWYPLWVNSPEKKFASIESNPYVVNLLQVRASYCPNPIKWLRVSLKSQERERTPLNQIGCPSSWDYGTCDTSLAVKPLLSCWERVEKEAHRGTESEYDQGSPPLAKVEVSSVQKTDSIVSKALGEDEQFIIFLNLVQNYFECDSG